MPSTYLPPDENKGPLILGILWTSLILGLIMVMLRFYTRVWLKGGLGWDDHCILTALALAISGIVANTLMVVYGTGRHIIYLSERQVELATEWMVISVIQSYFAVYLVKISVCLFVLRLLTVTQKPIARVIYVLMVALTLITIAAVVLICISCVPLKALFNPQASKHCFPSDIQTGITRAFGGIGSVTDLMCVLLPIYVIRDLHMKTETKVALSVIIAFGLLTLACSIGKTVVTSFAPKDPTWDLTNITIWAGLEANIGLFAASMPALRQLFNNVLQTASRRIDRSDSYRLNAAPAPIISFIRNLGRRNPVEAKDPERDPENDENELVSTNRGITRTMEVTIESQPKRDAEGFFDRYETASTAV